MADAAFVHEALPVGSKGRHASGWWGMIALVVTEGALFAYLIFSYFYIASQAHAAWPPAGRPHLWIAVPGTIILIVGSFTARYAEVGIRRGNKGRLIGGMAITVVLGLIFLALQGLEWHDKPFSFTSSAYSSLYFTVTGFHMLHVAIGLVIITMLMIWTGLDYFGAKRHAAASIGAIYWHFVTVVWLFVFSTFYIAPYLG
ncbi:MAG TPA: cytochrome c oxidase subunit 3 [Casimicrobiaceae bacterium]|nr:cytochrome c oxidase subunit 3 [Casimicrobiaceae bacterium]